MRAVELDNVRDVMLLEAAEQMRAEPIPRHAGAPAPLGRLEAKLRAARATEDLDAERLLSLELSRIHFEHHLDVDMAVQLLHRALEIEDDRALRRDLARRLSSMGRHVEAGHVLRDGEPETQEEVFASWLASGEAYARAGDADEAVATFREAAMVSPESPLPYARIAEVAYWAPDLVAPERAADGWLEASKRFEVESDDKSLSVLRAFEVAPTYARSTEAYTTLLRGTGRRREADEIWRTYGIASGHTASVAARRASRALRDEDLTLALAATLDGHVSAVIAGEPPQVALASLLAEPRVEAWLTDAGGEAQTASAIRQAADARASLSRADAFAGVATALFGEPSSVLWALAAEAYAAAGDTEAACRSALAAAAAAPWLPHAQAALMALGADERVALADIELAVGRMPGRSALLNLAATRFEGHHVASLYARKAALVRPCDLVPLENLLERALRLEDASAVVEAIGFVLDAARPLDELADALASALTFVTAHDLPRAQELAKRTLALIGPTGGRLYEALRAAARAAGDKILERALVLGRAVSDQVPDEERADVYLEAATISLDRGDVHAAAIHTSRAAAHNGDLERVLDAIERIHAVIVRLPEAQRSDALIALARANAWAAEQQEPQAAVEAWRYLGALRWDLADDRIGADEAFFVACAIEPDTGPYRYAIDLRDRAGPADAFSMLVERAVNVEHEGGDTRLLARLYAAAARVAADAGLKELAIDAAVAAVRADPSRGDAVAIVEKTADGEQGLNALNFVYDTLADSALGRYGFRAAHYRAARQLEKLHANEDALRHAVQAFEAVPNVGASYRMLLRLAERTGKEDVVVSTVTSVVSSFPLERQIAWLARASDLAHRSQAGLELRLELLLKAFVLRPSTEVIELLGQAADAALDEPDPAVGELLRDRLRRAVEAALPKLEGHHAPTVAVALAAFAANSLRDAALAIQALLVALSHDTPELDVTAVVAHAPLIASESVLARELLGRINDLRGDRKRRLTSSVKDLTSRLYLELSDVTPPPPTPVPRDEDVEGPAFEAPESFASLGGPDPESTPAPIAPEREAPAPDGTGSATTPVVPIPDATDSDAAVLDAHLEAILDGTREADAEQRLFDAHFDALEDGEGRPSDPANHIRIVGRPPLDQDDLDLALGDAPLGAPAPDGGALLDAEPARSEAVGGDLERDAPAGDDDDARDAGGRRTDVTELDDEDYVTITTPPSEEALDTLEDATASAAASVSDTSELEPRAFADAPPALDFSPESEAQARARGDYAAIAAMLAARIARSDNPEQRRVVRLRRAAVLEQRLNDVEGAAGELELILEETGDDPTVLRYLADLRDRQERYARAAKLWLRASQCAVQLDEKIRDVTRCCESLVKAGRPETAKKLIDAARGLPQSPRLLKVRITVARRLDDAHELATAEAELAALGAARREPLSTPPPRPIDPTDEATAPEERPRRLSSIPPRHPFQPNDGTGRNVFRVTNAPLPELGDEHRSAADTLEACRRSFVERGPQSVHEAKRMIRRLRSIAPEIADEDRDLFTYLLVECFDAAQGSGAATHALQQHWERHGGTPLVTAAVADRLVRRGDIRAALLLYARVLGKDLRDVRDDATIALEAAHLAYEEADEEHTVRFLHRALEAAHTRPDAKKAVATWYPSGLPEPRPAEESIDEPTLEALSAGDLAAEAPSPFAARSKTPTDAPPPPTPGSFRRPQDDPTGAETEGEGEDPEAPISLDRMSLSDDGDAMTIDATSTDAAPASVQTPSGPLALRHGGPEERALFDELAAGRFEAGDELAERFAVEGDRRLLDRVTVRRLQATLRRGDRSALRNLRDAAASANAEAYTQAIEHVLYAFDADQAPAEPPPLSQLAAQPELTRRLLFAHLDGTINEALAIVCDSGMMRREMSDYDFTGTDRVPPVATTPVGRCFAALTRLIDLGNTRLFHRSRSRGRLEGHVALLNPLAAYLTGHADRETATLRYVLGSTLAAATPPLALIEGLDERDGRNLLQALVAGFGPVEETSMHETSQAQMRIAEDLWHMVGSAADHRLRELCSRRGPVSFEAARQAARVTRRRAGLFACGDLVTAIMQVVHEVDLPMPRPIRGAQALEALCQHPEIRDLYDLALLPEYAEARWQTV